MAADLAADGAGFPGSGDGRGGIAVCHWQLPFPAEQRRKTWDRLALAGVVCTALLLFFLPHWLAAPAGILFGAWFLLLFLVRGLCAVECWRRDLHGKYRHSTASLLSLLFSILLFASPA